MSARHTLPVVLILAAAACGSHQGDPGSDAGPSPVGSGKRIHQIRDPASPDRAASGAVVNLTGAAVLHVDSFDETRDGKSRGTVWVQDVGSQAPYSGVSLFSPSFVPANLKLAPGDVLDLDGQFVEVGSIGSANFGGKLLPQMSKPTATFRYEHRVPDPVVIDPNDLNDYDKGRRWLGMLVRVENVVIDEPFANNGRVTAHITADTSLNGAVVSNELFDLGSKGYPGGQQFRSITGIVTWFFSYKIAPRSDADLQL